MSIATAQSMIKELITIHACSIPYISQEAGVSTKTIRRILNGAVQPSLRTETNLMHFYWFYKSDMNQAKPVLKIKPVDPAIKKPKILLVQEVSITQEMHLQYLQDLNCETTIATSAKEAFEKYTDDFDMLLVDTLLPDISGLEVCAMFRVKKKYKRAPIILLTTQKDLTKKDCAWLDVDEVVAKPFSSIELKEILQRFFSTASAEIAE